MSVTKILVVDDFLPWQDIVCEMLQSEADLKIIATATDGLEAVQKATELQPDVILMDLSLPRMNGFEATRQIRTASPASKILFLSNQRDFDLIEAAFQVGGLGYVLKSDSSFDLVTGIRVILRGQQFVSLSVKDWRDGLG
jgi:two-component system, NarL family, nitrate/nitrite response regulator NarL